VIAQHRAGRLVGGRRCQQQALAADVVMPEPAGIFLALDDNAR
jgi:hypothetical protein